MRKGSVILLVLAVAPPVQGASPLPSYATRVQPAVHFLIDSSGSMGTCDAEMINEAQDLIPAPGGGYLYNPRLDRADDGACNGGARRADQPYRINRLEAVKLSIARILDADGNGVIDDADEQILRLKVGLSQFGAQSELYRTNTATLRPIGSSFSTIWEAARQMLPSGNTPSGPALAGARALSLQNCYDGNPATPCDLGPRQNDVHGDDVALGCREYYAIFLTDGEPNTSSSQIGFDPIPVAKSLREKVRITPAEPAPRARLRTIAIGFGSEVDGVGSVPRGVINCMGYWGGDAVSDADKDGDKNPATMDDDSNPATPGETVTCTAQSSLRAVEKAYGNGYFANDSRSLSNTFRKILNAIQAGTYSRSEPAVTGTSSTAASDAVYGSYFEVAPAAVEWEGHLKKYLYNAAFIDSNGTRSPRYVDCDNPAATSNPVHPCWDAGARLRTRDWRTRTLYFANASGVGFSWTTDLAAAARTGWTGTDATRPQTVRNGIPALMGVDLANPVAGGELAAWVAMASLRDSTHTYAPGDVVPAPAVNKALQALSFAAGRPDATFADGTKKCGQASCGPATAVSKLGDSFNSRPVVVGPPVGLVSDPDYAGEFLRRPLAAYTGTDAARLGTGSAASPCPAGVSSCTVGRRRTVVYLAANDGAVHAFDDETGDELWAFIPPGHMARLAQAREGRAAFIDAPPVVRDVKFPCERDSAGACRAAAQNLPFEDGRWHTLLLYGQGTGGNFYFALDVTNPVAPVFLWEYRDPARMGLTVSPAAIAEIPVSSLATADQPGVAAFLSGGFRPGGGDGVALHSVRPFDGALLAARLTDPHDLRDEETRPFGLNNGMTGTPRPVDGDGNGVVDRLFVGDREGRMWKACALRANGDFQMRMFFDPALYDRIDGSGAVGQPVDPRSPTASVPAAGARRALRGPLFFPPDVAFDQSGKLLVAFGSGNLLDPLSAPEEYRNFVWTVTDDPASARSCDPARATAMSGADGVVTLLDGTAPATFERVLPATQVLSAAPLIFGGRLYYAEFDPDPDGDVCTDDFVSRVIARNALDGSEPGVPPFRDAQGNPTSVQTHPGTVVTGIRLDPRHGTLFVQTSTGDGPPAATSLPEASGGIRVVAYRTPN